MRKVLSAITMVGALMAASAASAASLFFEFDEGLSSISITSNTPNCLPGFGCQLWAVLETPFDSITIDEGDTATFDFATFFVSAGFGFENDARVEAVLAFITPDAGPVSTGGSANYIRLGGFFRPGVVAGNLIWDDPVQQITAADGSVFTVSFQNLQGVTFGGNATSSLSITVNSVAAVPEPATWALMIGGFGLAGATLRRRRALAA